MSPDPHNPVRLEDLIEILHPARLRRTIDAVIHAFLANHLPELIDAHIAAVTSTQDIASHNITHARTI